MAPLRAGRATRFPAASSSPTSHLPGGMYQPRKAGEARPWWWYIVPIKPNPYGKPDTDGVADWLDAAIPFI